LKTLEEPPYLTVGTDVSAKYRGAFCEAKIKTAKRLVKAKVTFKSDLTTAEVHDENIKGPLKVGAVVEVKNQNGVYQEATINKLTDASIYTVVFDDGDEKTLRRSSLCLKGARHFAESETLDRLPLTNPEHFGTPVIGKKGNRGRRSNPEEESSSSSSEEEENDQRQNEDLFGKVVMVEGVTSSDKKKPSWYPALVISPDCHEDVAVKKDTILIRSFKDGKFAWKTEVKEDSSSSEEDEEEEAEEQEEDEEVEPFPEERENFLQQLYKFMEDRGTPINKRPVLGYRNLNLFKLYRLVHKLGGFDNIESGSVWKQVYQDLGIPVLNSAAGYNVKCAYRKYLYGFEEYCTSSAITFRMDLPVKQVSKGEVKPAEAAGAAPSSSTAEEQKAQIDGDSGSAQSLLCKVFFPTIAKVEVSGWRCCERKLLGSSSMTPRDDPHPVFVLRSRYDEWIKADKILRPANKNVPKIKHRKKIKNKAERERDRLERLSHREVLGPPSSHVLRSKCGLSQDVFSKMDDGEDKGTPQSPVKSIEITSILNGLQASELSTEESEHEDGDREVPSEEQHGPSLKKSPAEPPPPLPPTEQWENEAPADKSSSVSGKGQESTENVGKLRGQAEAEAEASSTRKRKSDGAAERTPKGQPKAKVRNTRGGEWLPKSSPKKPDDVAASPGGERAGLSCSSSDDDSSAPPEPQVDGGERSRPKSKASPSKKYNGMKEKTKPGRQAGFWETPEKRAKASANPEDRAAVRPKGQKDVWSSIQAQWPKKTLKDLFSDSDTEAANSPPPPACLKEPGVTRQDPDLEEEASEEQMELDKLQEFPSSGSNSVLNTPPTTPESPSGGGSVVEDSAQAPPSSPQTSTAPMLPLEPVPDALPPGPIQEEVAGGRSETDSSTVEVESLGGELPDLPQEDGEGSPSKVYGVNLSCNSSSYSPERSCSSQQDCEQKSKGTPVCGNLGLNDLTNSSDSEDHSAVEGKPAPSKHTTSDPKASPKCHGRSPPSGHKFHKQGDPEPPQHRDSHGRSARVYKWSFQMSDLEKMSSLERIAFLQEKLQDIRNHYLSLKSEVASIDRRRKRMKKKERESTVAACSSSSSSSSSPSSSSLTAAVMLTLADPPVPSSSSSSQNSGLSVECR
uniref:Translocase of outer mitochondrial membrane 20 n=1 Tax=Oryzias latipes TaxID=8090 RepID=A0A3P9JUG3_ORYLA